MIRLNFVTCNIEDALQTSAYPPFLLEIDFVIVIVCNVLKWVGTKWNECLVSHLVGMRVTVQRAHVIKLNPTDFDWHWFAASRTVWELFVEWTTMHLNSAQFSMLCAWIVRLVFAHRWLQMKIEYLSIIDQYFGYSKLFWRLFCELFSLIFSFVFFKYRFHSGCHY